MIAVADAFDSMTSNRSYRGARSIEEAVAELRKCSGMQFDPVLVDAFIAALSQEHWESEAAGQSPPATLPDGFPAQVAAQDHDDPTAPLRVVE
ncbi:MAG TPA: metal-dependent phosphohydrolase, partial [Streptosporangiaceae bacterium]|nr:metal-dependent phosphohydrolase [Streptosporangiaceae bacterium]